MITTQQVRIVLDRNQHGLDGRPRIESGATMDVGLYWDAEARKLVPVESRGVADRRLVLLSPRLDVTIDELVPSLAMGGGGSSGRAIAYHVGAASQDHH
jgi:hypothetical protein